jgi:16S rRNA (guanine527-N7)-methyltransferase
MGPETNEEVGELEFRGAIERLLEGEPSLASAVPAASIPVLSKYLESLRRTNESMNLVSARMAAPDRLVGDLLADSLRGLSWLPASTEGHRFRLFDVGSGGGFPAIPLLACRPDMEGVLVESTGKKARFLKTVVGDLGLTADVWNVRFPDLPVKSVNHPNDSFDILTTRAVAEAGEIVRQARPWLRPGARALLWTTAELFEVARRRAGAAKASFNPAAGSEHSGIGVLECFT